MWKEEQAVLSLWVWGQFGTHSNSRIVMTTQTIILCVYLHTFVCVCVLDTLILGPTCGGKRTKCACCLYISVMNAWKLRLGSHIWWQIFSNWFIPHNPDYPIAFVSYKNFAPTFWSFSEGSSRLWVSITQAGFLLLYYFWLLWTSDPTVSQHWDLMFIMLECTFTKLLNCFII